MVNFPYYNGTGSTFVSVNPRNNVGPRFIIPSIYGYKRIHVAGSVKIWEIYYKISVNIRLE